LWHCGHGAYQSEIWGAIFQPLESFEKSGICAPDKRYRTSPLAGLWTHSKRGFYHDARFNTLLDVVNHYDSCYTLGLVDQEKADLVEFLKTLH
jgi:hypothetical protein